MDVPQHQQPRSATAARTGSTDNDAMATRTPSPHAGSNNSDRGAIGWGMVRKKESTAILRTSNKTMNNAEIGIKRPARTKKRSDGDGSRARIKAPKDAAAITNVLKRTTGAIALAAPPAARTMRMVSHKLNRSRR